MPNNRRTENVVSYFEKLPTEVIWMIASLCDHGTIVALASTSSHMRFKVLPLIHKQVVFWGQQDSLKKLLADFSGCQPLIKSRIYSIVSSAIIVVLPKPGQRGLRADRDDKADGLAERILEALQTMPNLRSLSLHLRYMNYFQEAELYHRMLFEGATEIQYLQISSSTRVMRRLLQTCPALTTLEIGPGFKMGRLHEIPPTVKRLGVTLHVESHLSSSVWIPSLKVENIRHIVRLNSCLEELILRDYEKNTIPFHPLSIKDGELDAIFKNALREAGHELSRLPKLQRLAINIWRGTSSQVRSHSQLVLLKKKDWHNNWYSDCTRRLGEALPHIQQICIISGNHTYWRGSRQMPNGTFLTEKRTMESGKKFPRTFNS
ncbi:unnamed protein product [Clonostachys chloroleuca]|uniref:F-box domain-containing protein n=1 Tax=Clonostachys chloroleuca TaxID=1926264 RepID=A0AA35MG47_9HYPO|nr:unnamed protein product [Clonostachys chloroleuca]